MAGESWLVGLFGLRAPTDRSRVYIGGAQINNDKAEGRGEGGEGRETRFPEGEDQPLVGGAKNSLSVETPSEAIVMARRSSTYSIGISIFPFFFRRGFSLGFV